ncbi:MAG: hypothetical protein J6P39_05560 [Oscillospiraceae bacterium]|nr:hypothetical protein [Oscillospiraceae bacterium]
MNKVIPDIPKIKAHWERRMSDIPDYLMVPMSDQRKVRYVPEIQQPKPFFREALDKFTGLCVGYERKEEA